MKKLILTALTTLLLTGAALADPISSPSNNTFFHNNIEIGMGGASSVGSFHLKNNTGGDASFPKIGLSSNNQSGYIGYTYNFNPMFGLGLRSEVINFKDSATTQYGGETLPSGGAFAAHTITLKPASALFLTGTFSPYQSEGGIYRLELQGGAGFSHMRLKSATTIIGAEDNNPEPVTQYATHTSDSTNFAFFAGINNVVKVSDYVAIAFNVDYVSLGYSAKFKGKAAERDIFNNPNANLATAGANQNYKLTSDGFVTTGLNVRFMF